MDAGLIATIISSVTLVIVAIIGYYSREIKTNTNHRLDTLMLTIQELRDEKDMVAAERLQTAIEAKAIPPKDMKSTD